MNIEVELRAEMARKNFSDAAMADELKISRQAFSRKKNGHVPFTFGEIEAASRALGVPAWELMRRTEESEKAIA